MLSSEENELLTRTGPGTPAGALLRRYWQPVALIEELASGAPLPVRILGEDLVLFRVQSLKFKVQSEGRPLGTRDAQLGTESYGLLGLHCSHRGADLSYGRVEDGGLRCIYHGWLYDINGRCLEQPGEPANGNAELGARSAESTSPRGPHSALRISHPEFTHTAYPCRAVGDLILAYLGPGHPPLIPAYDFLMAPEGQHFSTKVFHSCNYLQGNEGNLDPAHNAFLHWVYGRDRDPSPDIEPEETEFGVHVRRIRRVGPGRNVLSTSNFILPNLSAFPGNGAGDGYSVNWHVPIDDTHHWKYIIQFRREGHVDREIFWRGRSEVDGAYQLIRNQRNRYLQDRAEMESKTFIGLGEGFQAHDACAVEGAGPIQDRTQEHLGFTDRALLLSRQVLLRAIRGLEAGREPPNVVRDPDRNHFPRLAVSEYLADPEQLFLAASHGEREG